MKTKFQISKWALALGFTVISYLGYAQTNDEKTMAEQIHLLQQAQTPEDFDAVAQQFSHIAEQTPEDWLPAYYTALALLQEGRRMLKDSTQIPQLDPLTDKAWEYIKKAEAVSPPNAEIYILKKIYHNLKLVVNPQKRYLTEIPEGKKALKMAQLLDPENPRITLLQAEEAYFIPPNFGGNRTQAMALFKKALTQFETYRPKTALSPNWGKEEAMYFINSQSF
ncbi:hypothetical protein [Riemerella columbina]|uniref:hypothetical protein n=1 Tax=Riemerella columbina TaxID=103810 RepID=UPI00266EE7E4|nr:hypothetical protein [Riemerella columbina]WKS95175.1 hypothetical protein NYR17_00095 [Riemerella columbina]